MKLQKQIIDLLNEKFEAKEDWNFNKKFKARSKQQEDSVDQEGNILKKRINRF